MLYQDEENSKFGSLAATPEQGELPGQFTESSNEWLPGTLLIQSPILLESEFKDLAGIL